MSDLLHLVDRATSPPGSWYVLSDTGDRIQGGDLNSLVGAWRIYREARGLPVPSTLAEMRAIVEDLLCRRLPSNAVNCNGSNPKPVVYSHFQPLPTDERDDKLPDGPNRGASPRAWAKLHRTAISGKLDTAWIAKWMGAISCGKCKVHAQQWLVRLPVRYDDQFKWSHEYHEAVNKALGKPAFSLQQAIERWS